MLAGLQLPWALLSILSAAGAGVPGFTAPERDSRRREHLGRGPRMGAWGVGQPLPLVGPPCAPTRAFLTAEVDGVTVSRTDRYALASEGDLVCAHAGRERRARAGTPVR